MVNKKSTRYYSNEQEKQVCVIINGTQQSNSGGGKFRKGDVINHNASILCECKTVTTDKESFSIKREWFEKNKQECFTQRVSNQCIAFSYGPNQPNYFVIDSKLMKYLIEKLEEENN